MRRIPVRHAPAALLALFALAGTALAGNNEAREIVERAIKAQGGEAALARAQQCTRKDVGTQALLGREVPFVTQVTRSLPDKLRLKIEVDRRFESTIVVDGDKGWQSEGGPAVQMAPQRLKEVREELYLWWLTTLVPLTRPGFTLSTLPDTKVEGEAAAGVKVVHKGHADTKMYFLKRNGLLAKVERRAPEAGLTVDKEYFYSSYKEHAGVKLPTKEVVKVNGRKWTEFTISDYAFPAKLDAKAFAKP
jgi:hypothetical protein